MAGALALGEYLAGAVVALMLAGGNALEELREPARAPRADAAASQRAPRIAHRRARRRASRRCPSTTVAAGDSCSCAAGEVVPVDGVVASERRPCSTSPR